MKKIIEYSVLVILLLPLLSINIKSSHDWGDDFAQYLHQAKNITSGISQNETGYVFNPDAFLGPRAYPVGFPLLLAPVVNIYGLNYEVLNVYLSCYLLLSCFIGFLLLRQRFSAATSVITTLIIAYNPVTLSFKTEILSDIPFFFFSLLILFLALKKQSVLLSVAIGLLLGFCFHIRSVALMLLLSVILHRLIILIRTKQLTLRGCTSILLIVGSFTFMFLLIRICWPANSSYPELFEAQQPFLKAMNHLSYHNEEFHRFFRNFELNNFFFILCISASCLTCFTWLGFFYELKHNRYTLLNLYVIMYVGALLLYVYGDTGIRFIFPIIFILFYYAIIGLRHAVKPLTSTGFWLPYIIGFFVLFSYHEAWQKINEHEKDVLEGPETANAKDVFSYITTHTPKEAIIAFDKPRALALYTNRQGVCLKYECSKEELVNSLKQFRADYMITYSGLTSETNRKHAQDSTTHLKEVFNNGAARIYKCMKE